MASQRLQPLRFPGVHCGPVADGTEAFSLEETHPCPLHLSLHSSSDVSAFREACLGHTGAQEEESFCILLFQRTASHPVAAADAGSGLWATEVCPQAQRPRTCSSRRRSQHTGKEAPGHGNWQGGTETTLPLKQVIAARCCLLCTEPGAPPLGGSCQTPPPRGGGVQP